MVTPLLLEIDTAPVKLSLLSMNNLGKQWNVKLQHDGGKLWAGVHDIWISNHPQSTIVEKQDDSNP